MAEITIHSAFGRAMFVTIRSLRLRRILEIGSYDGDGSTQVLVKALEPAEGKRLVCLEMREERFRNLCANTAEYSWVQAVNAPSVSIANFTNCDFDRDIWPFYSGRDAGAYATIRGWWEDDVRGMREFRGNGFLDLNTEKFDGVLIDGGEFSAFDEFRKLEDKAFCFFLDDVFKVFKNRKVYEHLRVNPQWICLHENRSDRNGTAIFCRRDRMPSRAVYALRQLRAELECLVLRLRRGPT